LPFVGSMILMAIGVVLAFRMQPESKFDLTSVAGAHPTPHLGV